MMEEWAATTLLLLPLSLAAGVDLYLTLLFLGLANRLGWESLPPGSLGELAVPGIFWAAGLLYLIEWGMERRTVPYLCWNALHTVVRPVAGALLTYMALEGIPDLPRMAGAFAAGALTQAAHMTRSGWGLLMALLPTPPRIRFLVSVAEDVGTLALLSLFLDAPSWAALLAAFITGVGLLGGRPAGAAFAFALRLFRGAARALLGQKHWTGPAGFPGWVDRALGDPVAPGGGLRGVPAGAFHLPGQPIFREGWLVARGGSPLFVYRSGFATRVYDLGEAQMVRVRRSALHNRAELTTAEGGAFALYVGLDGPGQDDLFAELSG